MNDLLNFDYINSLPQPFSATLVGDDDWPVIDICVKSGIVRLDICGAVDIMDISDVVCFTDSLGSIHYAETFFTACESNEFIGDL